MSQSLRSKQPWIPHEALLAEDLRHPNLVSLYDFSSLPDGTLYIVWEYVEGDTVATRMSRGDRFTTSEVVHLVGQIAEGLGAAHRQGILHRDISPDNIMVSERDGATTAKVLDFGIAKITQERLRTTTGSGLFFGKIGYSSPEQMGFLDERVDLDPRTDVFSLAVVSYLMLSGRLPFRSSSIQAYLRDVVISDEHPVLTRSLGGLDEPWREVFRHAMSRNRDERTPSMEAFKSELEAAWKANPSGVDDWDPVSRPGHALTRSWSNRRLVRVAATLLVSSPLLYWIFDFRGTVTAPLIPEGSTTTIRSDPEPLPLVAPPPSVASTTTTSVPTTTTAPPPSVEPAFGTLTVSATPQASVILDGKLIGITPMEIQVEPGSHAIVLTTPRRVPLAWKRGGRRRRRDDTRPSR